MICPVHKIPDCSPLLNGCTILTKLRAYTDPKPEPGDGPDFEADLKYWLLRNPGRGLEDKSEDYISGYNAGVRDERRWWQSR